MRLKSFLTQVFANNSRFQFLANDAKDEVLTQIGSVENEDPELRNEQNELPKIVKQAKKYISCLGVFILELWGLRFPVVGSSFSSLGIFGLRSSFSGSSFSTLPTQIYKRQIC